MEVRIFVDMDGVLVNTVPSMCEAHNKPYPYPDFNGSFHLEDLWDISLEEFYKPLDYNFWANLPPYDNYLDLIKACENKGDVYILSSPGTFGKGVYDGKRDWIKKYLPEYTRKLILTQSKEACATSNSLLIDDYEKNINAFNKAGGNTILVPRPWNKRYNDIDTTIEEVLKWSLK